MPVLISITIFVLLGTAFIFGTLAFGSWIRSSVPSSDKSATYECGEPTLGSSWVQFDLRFYIIALLFLVFDVEVALFYPWAVVYGDAAVIAKQVGLSLFQLRATAVVDMLVFFGILLVGFAYLWRFGYLDWVTVKPASTPVSKAAGSAEALTAPSDAEAVAGPLMPA